MYKKNRSNFYKFEQKKIELSKNYKFRGPIAKKIKIGIKLSNWKSLGVYSEICLTFMYILSDVQSLYYISIRSYLNGPHKNVLFFLFSMYLGNCKAYYLSAHF